MYLYTFSKSVSIYPTGFLFVKYELINGNTEIEQIWLKLILRIATLTLYVTYRSHDNYQHFFNVLYPSTGCF